MAPTGVLRLMLLSALAASAFGLPYAVELLSDKQLEHQTQASTGQTTGWWAVHFFTNKCPECDALNALLDEVAPKELTNVIFSKVNCAINPDVAKRFGITQFPHLVLFKDRKMFVHPEPSKIQAQESLLRFVDHVSDSEEGLPVPEPSSFLAEVALELAALHAEHPTAVYCVMFLGISAVALSVLALIFPRGKFSGKEE
mmetsp:Transcript_38374/g.108475  ORF Transcript_38374/g.108475 Transcript_38374/m.108475 type:complete len:199 (-) Transcript_38374:252-848(-)|eukprot:CAMPEP_0117678516 /NCGR_PEP_ID=MMETSP0804-20121206/17340_1 /TAXON_ID=1074897 /ORGANISM="Tetraselmis astigmatica, Strain CCMP880" /LENGTH=198 /DNA_ID=CAMNT_0005487911 /DNA_START=372 /DNA_END=968 /DNA_ORIENTATION=+